MEQERYKQIENAAVRIVLAVLIILAAGTASIPAVLACVFGWTWLLLYPAALAVMVVWVKQRGGGRNG